MNSLATVDYYNDNYLMGKQAVIDTALFPFYARKATQVIKQYTFDNIDEDKAVTEVVQMCCCELAEWLYKKEKSGSDEISMKGISSESNSHYSVSFESDEKRKQSEQLEQMKIVHLWLDGTGLLYRGVRNVCRK